MSAPQCLSCHVEMKEGFIPDHTYGGVHQPVWVEGAPEKSFWTGIKIPYLQFPVRTYRCSRCGRLESFASPPRDTA